MRIFAFFLLFGVLLAFLHDSVTADRSPNRHGRLRRTTKKVVTKKVVTKKVVAKKRKPNIEIQKKRKKLERKSPKKHYVPKKVQKLEQPKKSDILSYKNQSTISQKPSSIQKHGKVLATVGASFGALQLWNYLRKKPTLTNVQDSKSYLSDLATILAGAGVYLVGNSIWSFINEAVEAKKVLDDIDDIKPELPQDFSLSNTQPLSFYNPGNYCYMNSVMQVLLATESLHQALYQKFKDWNTMNNYQKFKDWNTMNNYQKWFLAPFIEIRKSMDNRTDNKVLMNNLRHQIKPKGWAKDQFTRQQDAKEFLEWLIHSDEQGFLTPLLKERFLIERMSLSKRQLENIGEVVDQVKADPVYSINLKINNGNQSVSLNDLMNNEFSYQHESHEKYGEYEHKYQMTNAPENLILNIQRYSADGSSVKIKTPVEFNMMNPIELDKDKCVQGTVNYQLYAAILHHGNSVKHGHYTAEVKYGDQWWYANDAEINANNFQSLCDAYYDEATSTCTSTTVSLLFYKKINV